MDLEFLPTNESKYCVYLHKRKTDGVVFYIGSGIQGKREFHFTNRSKSWHYVKDHYGVEVEVYANNLSKIDARNLEDRLISSGDYSEIVNTNKVCKSYKSIKIEDLDDLLEYDESSPTCLRWTNKQSKLSLRYKVAGTLCFDKKGKPCGSSIKFKNKTMQINRLVWVIHNGYLAEDLVVDHIDGDRHNNNISNLRAITIAENARNRSCRVNKKNSHLPSGVYETESYFISSVVIADKRKSASFAKLKYGYQEAKQKAISWRSSMIRKLNVLGANYSERHFKTVEEIDICHKSSAYTGVPNTSVKLNKDGSVKTYQAHFVYLGKSYEKSFAVSRYGEDEARRMAIEFATKSTYTEEDTLKNSSIKVEVLDSLGVFIAKFNSAPEVAQYLGLDVGKVYKNLSGEVKKRLVNQQGDEVILRRVQIEVL